MNNESTSFNRFPHSAELVCVWETEKVQAGFFANKTLQRMWLPEPYLTGKYRRQQSIKPIDGRQKLAHKVGANEHSRISIVCYYDLDNRRKRPQTKGDKALWWSVCLKKWLLVQSKFRVTKYIYKRNISFWFIRLTWCVCEILLLLFWGFQDLFIGT